MMAGRPKEPIDLLLSKGKSHLTKKEIADRKEEEIKVPFKDVEPPVYLTEEQKEKFTDIADKLLAIGIMTELDVDCLAMYVLSHSLYLSYTDVMMNCIKNDNIDGLKDIQIMQDKAFRQAQTSARDLGLTITSRCKLVVPPPQEDDDDEL
jgi:P27 family predicted phage terminase small subunit